LEIEKGKKKKNFTRTKGGWQRQPEGKGPILAHGNTDDIRGEKIKEKEGKKSEEGPELEK